METRNARTIRQVDQTPLKEAVRPREHRHTSRKFFAAILLTPILAVIHTSPSGADSPTPTMSLNMGDVNNVITSVENQIQTGQATNGQDVTASSGGTQADINIPSKTISITSGVNVYNFTDTTQEATASGEFAIDATTISKNSDGGVQGVVALDTAYGQVTTPSQTLTAIISMFDLDENLVHADFLYTVGPNGEPVEKQFNVTYADTAIGAGGILIGTNPSIQASIQNLWQQFMNMWGQIPRLNTEGTDTGGGDGIFDMGMEAPLNVPSPPPLQTTTTVTPAVATAISNMVVQSGGAASTVASIVAGNRSDGLNLNSTISQLLNVGDCPYRLALLLQSSGLPVSDTLAQALTTIYNNSTGVSGSTSLPISNVPTLFASPTYFSTAAIGGSGSITLTGEGYPANTAVSLQASYTGWQALAESPVTNGNGSFQVTFSYPTGSSIDSLIAFTPTGGSITINAQAGGVNADAALSITSNTLNCTLNPVPNVASGAVQATLAYPQNACIDPNNPNLGGNGDGVYQDPYSANKGFNGMGYYAWGGYIIPPNPAPFFWIPNASVFVQTNAEIASGEIY